MHNPKRVLVLCTGNSCRSQMAHGYLEKFGGDGWEIFSAGIETHGLNPLSVKVMQEDHVDISHHTSNHIDEYRELTFDFVITVCDHARETCPWFPSKAELIHQNFEDPARATGNETEILSAFRNVRDQIKTFTQQFFEQHQKFIG